MIFNFGKSCESTRPTGSCFAFTTIKSSMFRSLKIFSASTASAFSQMQIGLRVITFFNGCDKQIFVRRHVPAEIAVGENADQFAARVHDAQAAGFRVRHHEQRFLDREIFVRNRVAIRRCA